MAYLFEPPTVSEGPAGGGRLFAQYVLPRGVTVLVTGGVVSEVRFPTQEEVDAADYAYRGGYIHLISDEEAAVLLSAGYSPTVYDPLEGS